MATASHSMRHNPPWFATFLTVTDKDSPSLTRVATPFLKVASEKFISSPGLGEPIETWIKAWSFSPDLITLRSDFDMGNPIGHTSPSVQVLRDINPDDTENTGGRGAGRRRDSCPCMRRDDLSEAGSPLRAVPYHARIPPNEVLVCPEGIEGTAWTPQSHDGSSPDGRPRLAHESGSKAQRSGVGAAELGQEQGRPVRDPGARKAGLILVLNLDTRLNGAATMVSRKSARQPARPFGLGRRLQWGRDDGVAEKQTDSRRMPRLAAQLQWGRDDGVAEKPTSS